MSYYSVPDSEREFTVETPPTLDTDSNYTTLSPYLNFDPSYLPSQPEYIFPYGQRQRGQFEYAFYYIGASCFTGALVGGVRGFVNGLNLTTLAGQTGRIRRTRILNHIMRHGAATSNTLGSIAFLYSSAGVIISQFRPGDDELNSIFSATLTGLIYKSPGGIRKGLLGSAIGCGLASLYWIISSREKLSYIAEKIPSPSTSSPTPVLTSYFKRDKTEVPVEKEEEEEDLSMK